MSNTRLYHGHCEVLQQKDFNCVVLQWSGSITEDEFKLVHESVLALFKPTNFTRIVTNASNLENLSRREINWLQNKWIPEAMAKGFGACVLIEPANSYKH